MSGESDDVDRLAQSIADGAPIDWEEIDKLPADARLRRLFALLQMVDEVAEVHRSFGDPSHATDLNDHRSPAPVDTAEDGDSVGRWGHLVLRRKIGEGGFGEVYHAHDTWLDHPVALKLFKPRTPGRDSTDRILHEARKLARIRHPNVVTVHGADSHDGRVGFWMDLIEGSTLEYIVRSRRLSAGEATYIGHEVCRALAAVHRAGIIHRDIKAQNVMRASEDGRIILMDFGAGEFMADAANSPQQGTPVYLAPEIFERAAASVRSDIYAVGVLLYFLVTRSFPVQGSSIPRLIDAHRRGERGRLLDGRPDLPHQFVAIVERALDPAPTRRFASAGEMEAALTNGSIADVRPIDVAGLQTKAQPRTIAQTMGLVVLGIVSLLVAAEVFGFIIARAFEVAMRIEPEFTAGPLDYLAFGARGLWPFFIFWLAGAAVVAALGGLRPLVRKPAAALRRMLPPPGAVDGETVAASVFLAAVTCWAALNWWCWDLFAAMEALRVGAPAHTVDLGVLGSADPLHRTHSNSSFFVTFVLGLALWRWFPRIEKDAADPSRIRFLRWAVITVIILTLATAVAPRRFVWENFEVVAFENQRAFVIGNNREELLLYYPYNDTPRHRRVRVDDPQLQRTGVRARIFNPQ